VLGGNVRSRREFYVERAVDDAFGSRYNTILHMSSSVHDSHYLRCTFASWRRMVLAARLRVLYVGITSACGYGSHLRAARMASSKTFLRPTGLY
jgi:hypothetical protein